MLALAALPAAVAGCAGRAPGRSEAAGPARGGGSVRPGIEVLLADSAHLVRGRRVGLVTNQNGIDARGTSDVELLRDAGVRLVALFSPEHGFRGAADPGAAVASSVDSATGLPIYSLYGRTAAPTDTMLAGIDVMLVDLQDAGARYYTYISTAVEVMTAAARRGIAVVILDRPDPIGGAVQGNVLDTAFTTFVGRLPVAMRHGMTLGEMARAADAWLGVGLGSRLSVVPAAGWRRRAYFDETGLPFIPPSPNLRTLEALIHYPGTCLFEGTNLSVGRGTERAFEQVGAPWLDTARVLGALRAAAPAGVEFEGVQFTPVRPGDGKYADTLLAGIRLRVTDRGRYDPTVTAVRLLAAVRDAHPDRLGWIPRHFDRLAGTDRLREGLVAGRPADSLVAGWAAERAAFEARRRPYLIYPE
jgi:uncharacterized protein YbbC (DUF1343 family)